MKKIIMTHIESFVTVKILLLILSIIAVPVMIVYYRIFEYTYYSYFGIFPEIYSPPIFSSGLLNTSFILVTFFWLLKIIIITSIVIGSATLFIKVNKRLSLHKKETEIEKNQAIDQNKKSKFAEFADDFIDSFKVQTLFIILLLLVITTLATAIKPLSKEAKELAKRQINNYLVEPFHCNDGFTNNNIGCFEIEGIAEKDLLVLTNTKTHLVYLSRYKDESGKIQAKAKVLEKDPKKSYKITRNYQRVFNE